MILLNWTNRYVQAENSYRWRTGIYVPTLTFVENVIGPAHAQAK